jgi:hypothetical protein
VKLFIMIGLFYVLIPIFGIEGAIITIGISNLINLLLFYFLVELKIVPSQKIILFTFSFIGINFLLIFSENTKFVSLISIGQFFVFGFLFIHYYWSKIKKHIALS